VLFVTEHEPCTPHNHALTQNTAEAMAFPAMRSIPDELLPIAKDLKDSGAIVKDVYSFLQHSVRKEGNEPLFTYDKVYYAVSASAQERALDATNLTTCGSARTAQTLPWTSPSATRSGCHLDEAARGRDASSRRSSQRRRHGGCGASSSRRRGVSTGPRRRLIAPRETSIIRRNI